MDRFHELHVFRRTVEAGNVTHAAETLHVSQPAVSRTLSGLEARLGVQLLRRSKRGVVPTEAGHSLYREATDLLDRLAEVEALAAARHTALAGTVRLAAATITFVNVIAPILEGFSRSHPGVAVDAALGTQPLDLLAENIDLAVRGGRPGGQELKFRKLGQVEVALFAAPAYLETHGMPVSPEQLARHVLIDSPLSGQRIGWQMERVDGSAAMTMPVTPLHRSDEFLGAKAMAQAGMGITLMPLYSTIHGPLVRVMPDWRATGPSMFAVWPASRHMPARVRALLDVLIREVPARLRGAL